MTPAKVATYRVHRDDLAARGVADEHVVDSEPGCARWSDWPYAIAASTRRDGRSVLAAESDESKTRLLANRNGNGACRDEWSALDRTRRVGVRDGAGPADMSRIWVDRVELGDAVCPTRYDEGRVVRNRRRSSKAQPIAEAPDDGTGHHVQRGERAVATCEIDELSRSLHARCASCRSAGPAPRPPPAGLAGREVDRDEMVFSFCDH